MTKVTVDIEQLRGAAGNLSSVATTIEETYNTLTNSANAVYVPTESLASVPGYVEDLRDKSKTLDAKVDLAILINSGDTGNVPQSGTLSYEVQGADPDDLEGMEYAMGTAMANMGRDMASVDGGAENDPRIGLMKTYLEKWGSNENTACMMYSQLGPEGTLALTEYVGDHVAAGGSQQENAKGVLTLLKSALNTATNGWTPEVAEEFGAGLVWSSRYPDSDPNSVPVYPRRTHTDGLQWLLYNNDGASDPFMRGVAEKMDELQRQDAEAGTTNSWPWHGEPRFFYDMVDRNEAQWSEDIPSIVFHNLGNRPQLSFEFFNGHPERIGYWLSEHDHYAAGGDLSGIASAMDAASTDPTLVEAHPAETATLAGQAIHRLPSYVDKNALRGGTDATVRGVEMAPHLEHILETYLPAAATAYRQDHTKKDHPIHDANGDGVIDLIYDATSPAGDKIPGSPWFSSEDLNIALGIIGRDTQALLDMREAVNSAETAAIDPSLNNQELKNTTEYWSAVEGAFTNAVGTAAIADAKAKDDYALAWIELGNMTASEVADAVGANKSKASSVASSTLIEYLTKKAKSTWATNAEDERVSQDEMAGQALKDYRLRLLFAADAAGLNGYQNPESGETLEDSQPDSLADGVVANPDGTTRLISKAELDALDAPTRSAAVQSLQSMATSTDGLAWRIPGEGIDSAFNGKFEERYAYDEL